MISARSRLWPQQGNEMADYATRTRTDLDNVRTCSVTLRHAGAVVQGTCYHFSDSSVHLLADERVPTGALVQLTLVPGDGTGLHDAAGTVSQAPQSPAREDRFEVVVDLSSPPEPRTPRRLTPVALDTRIRAEQIAAEERARSGGPAACPPASTPAPHRGFEHDSRSISLDDLRPPAVEDVRPGDGPVRSIRRHKDTPSPERRSTTALLQRRNTTGMFVVAPEDSSDCLDAYVRYQQPESFAEVYESQIVKRRLRLDAPQPIAKGTRVRMRFRLPRQSVHVRASGKVCSYDPSNDPMQPSSIWLKLDRLPSETRRAFETAYAAMTKSHAEAIESSRSFWPFGRRKAS